MNIYDLKIDALKTNHEIEFKEYLLKGFDRSGEDNELKWLKDIVAFANSKGGVICVGVNKDSGDLKPFNALETSKTIERLYEGVAKRIEPKVEISVHEIKVPGVKDDAFILVIEVAPSKNKPIFVYVSDIPACFIRLSNKSVLSTPSQIVELVLNSHSNSFDSTKREETYSLQNFHDINRRYNEVSGLPEIPFEQLEKIGFVDSNGFLSNAAELFKDDSSSSLTQISLKAFRGYESSNEEIEASLTLSGNICQCIEGSLNFILSHFNHPGEQPMEEEAKLIPFPVSSIIAGLTNAYAHRNYGIKDLPIEVSVYLDRLEIKSPGSLLGGSHLNRSSNLLSIKGGKRNPVILETLRLLGYSSNRQNGYETIIDDYKGADAKHTPFVSCDSDYFALTLPSLTFAKGVMSESNPYPKIKLIHKLATRFDEKVLSCCYYEPRSLVEVASYLKVVPSTYLREHVLESLVAKGVLTQEQVGKAILYKTDKDALRAHLAQFPNR